mgnify:CR=1 FL=1
MFDFILRPLRRNFGRDKAYYRIIDDMFGFIPNNIELYKLALIHKSASLVLEDGRAINNERLEFLGDAVIEAVTSDYLFIEYPDRDEGFLTQLRSKIVSRQSLNVLAVNIGLDRHVISNGSTSVTQKHIYGDAFEAMIGAVYLDQGYEFVNQIVGGSIPKEYIPAVDAGIQGAMKSGILAGYNVVDVRVELYDGSYHEVDSSEMAFKIAGSMAFKDAAKKAGPIILEPMMKVVVIVPEEYMGDVIGDLNSRRGQIQGMEDRNGAKQINARVPLSEMFGYVNDLRSKTQGRGQYTMEPDGYEPVPKSISESIISERAKKD